MIANNTHKRLYEIILSTGSTLREKEESIICLLKLSFSDQSHFNFLLNQINWFDIENIPLISLLPKVIRLYRGSSKEAGKVIYNLLIDGMLTPEASSVIVETILDTLKHSQDHSTFLKSLRENSPPPAMDK